MTTTGEARGATTANEPLRLREKLSYGFGDLASVLYWQTFMVYLLFFYTDVFGISAAAAGTMFLLTRIWDGVNDPMMGMIADRTKTRWGRFRPYLLWMCVPFAVVGVLTFTTPALSTTGKVVYAYVTFTLLMMLYTAINIPYTAMLGVVTSDPIERTSLASIKFVFAFAAGIIVSATLLPMVKVLGQGDEAAGWQRSFGVYGLAAVAFFLVTFFGTRERVQPIATERSSVGRDVRDLLANRHWLILLATTITFILFVAIRASATTHYFKYYVGSQQVALPFVAGTYDYTALVSAFNTVGQVSSLVGVLLVPFLARWLGKKRAFVTLFAVAVASTAAFYLLAPGQLLAIFLLQVAGTVTAGPLSALIWPMYADTADYAEWKSGRRATGLVFSASTMSQKFGWAFGGFFAGLLLTLVGFQANMDPTPSLRHGLVLMMSLVPAALGLVSIVIVLFYRLDEGTMKQVEEDLAARRAAAVARPAVAR